VYLAWESEGDARERLRRRSLILWLAAGAVSLATLLATRSEAPRLWEGLTRGAAGEMVLAGILLAPASALALWRRRFQAARMLAAAQVVILLAGWARAQWPWLVYPDLTIQLSAAPEATLRAAALTLPPGVAVLVPSLWLLFSVFKGRNPRNRSATP
jgi:cytochrome bd ubiquinol oxidase subunit II